MIYYARTGYLPLGVEELNNLEILRGNNCYQHEVPFAIVEKVGRGKESSADLSGRTWLDSNT
jgi:hypothetical protein